MAIQKGKEKFQLLGLKVGDDFFGYYFIKTLQELFDLR
jgi:hypothetical protein